MFSHGSMLMLLMHESCSFVAYAMNQILACICGVPWHTKFLDWLSGCYGS